MNKDPYYYYQHDNGLSQPSYKFTMMYLQVLSSLRELLPEKYNSELRSFAVISNYIVASRACLDKKHNVQFKGVTKYLKENIKAIRKKEIVLDKPMQWL